MLFIAVPINSRRQLFGAQQILPLYTMNKDPKSSSPGAGKQN